MSPNNSDASAIISICAISIYTPPFYRKIYQPPAILQMAFLFYIYTDLRPLPVKLIFQTYLHP